MRVSSWGSGVLALVLGCSIAQAAPALDAPKATVVAAAPSPAEQDRALVDALIANDIEAIALQSGDKTQEALAREWERDRARYAKSELTPFVDMELERLWAMLATPEGTKALADELYPKFAEQATLNAAQFNGGIAMTLSSIASDSGLTPDEVQQVSQLMLAFQGWSNGMDWQDRARFDRAIDEIAGFARRSGVETATEIQLLPYEEAAALGDDAVATIKRVVRIYDLDVDAMLHSIRIEELSRNGDEATLRWSARVLDVPISIEKQMRYDRNDSRQWLTLDEIEQKARWQREAGANAFADVEVEVDDVEVEFGTTVDSGSCGESASDPDMKDQFWNEGK